MTSQSNGPHRNCGTLQTYFALTDSYPAFRANQRRLDISSRAYRREQRHFTSVAMIPVVVHVVYRDEADNISDEQVQSQIQVLNADFRAKNDDLHKIPEPFRHMAADACIQFELARIDPDGNPTDGITRTRTDKESFEAVTNDVKSSAGGGRDPWDTARYLNIWVCKLGRSLLGYAQFPGGPPDTDGVVVLNSAFGTTGTATAPFDLGRTATHEVGHYLNLSHIWGEERMPTCGDGDYVDDTPNQLGPNSGVPEFPRRSCPDAGPHGDLFVNYMDYVDDASMFMFTHGQVARMQAALEFSRQELVRNAGAVLGLSGPIASGG
jgi:Pregnancy-associated plasma protein-A